MKNRSDPFAIAYLRAHLLGPGEFAVCEAPEDQEKDRKDMLEQADETIKVLNSNKKFEKWHRIGMSEVAREALAA